MIFDSIVKNARSAITTEQIETSCQQFCDYIGFETYMVFGSIFLTMVDPPRITLSNTTRKSRLKPAEFEDLIHATVEHSTPVITANLPKNSPLQSSMFNIRRSRSKNMIGISFPVHFPSGRFAMLHVSTQVDGADYSDLIMTVLISGNLFAREIGTSLLRVLEYDIGVESPYLSLREKECLLLASDGLTPLNISKKLGLSTHTVLFHLKKARKKLSSKNLQGAISRALMTGGVSARIDSERR
ncbi:MAG: LuxR family transcriptional regulator [Gammaproteobacteria bacterium]|nr:LuxR family transcriptional regulator [Gammaproteobacteria bacterium]MDH5651730.1 LuxR family transcriptional regulator [Gammaproteobacteria bacterium]